MNTWVVACTMCFGAQETHLIAATRLGVLVLLAVVLAVQAAFAAIFLYLRRRAKRYADLELQQEWPELRSSPGTS